MKTYPEKIDLHMHTRVSDGTDSPKEILAKVKEAGIGLFSVTDHDAIKGCQELSAAITADDPKFICGAEFSCRDEKGKYHILAYGYDPNGESINALVDKGHDFRMRKTKTRLEQLAERFGIHLPENEIKKLLELDNPGKPHIGNLMVKYGFAVSKDEAIDNVLNKIKTKVEYLRPEEAIQKILESGGVPVLAHPTYGDGEQLIMGEEMEERILHLLPMGIRGLEAYYSGFTGRMTQELLRFAERFALYVTAGSDYHGSNKLVPLGDTNLDHTEDAHPALLQFLDRILS